MKILHGYLVRSYYVRKGRKILEVFLEQLIRQFTGDWTACHEDVDQNT